ncbi:hypothetical protein [Corynebacterium phocae]|nr:hypothetical protein [Corynebacterium phocae]KAA8722218.1 hypothetical protein F4V58_09320 [Corynebacterium phocae]
MKTYIIDPDHMLALARELDQQSRTHTVDAPPNPGGAVSEFCTALHAAQQAIVERDASLRRDLGYLARLAADTTRATMETDNATASAYAALREVM